VDKICGILESSKKPRTFHRGTRRSGEFHNFAPLGQFLLTMPPHSQKHLWKNFFVGLVLIVPALLEVAWRYPFALRTRYKVNRALRNWERDSKERRGRYRT
jgi:hypothetical protein